MAAWIRRGSETFHWDLYRRFGRPPVLVPPRWALYERIWEATASGAGDAGTASGRPESPDDGSRTEGQSVPPAAEETVLPRDWTEGLRSALAAQSGRSVCLVVPDATRVGAWVRLLPETLSVLADHFDERVLLVATGTHRPTASEELTAHLGAVGSGGSADDANALRGWRVLQNSEESFRSHRAIGRTSSGTEIRLHPAYLDADFRLLLGDVSYHYFAGFGGGPKLIFPGCGEPAAAARNHRRSLLPGGGSPWDWNEACAPGVSAGNPVLEEIEEAAALAPAEWSIVPVAEPPDDPEGLDPSLPARFPLRVIQGPESETRALSRQAHDRQHRISFTQRPDLLVVDAGGRPRDASFLQAQKSLQHARRFLEPGGRILWVARCETGTASATIDRYAADPADFRPDAEDLHVQTLAALRNVTRSYEIGLWSDLPEERVRALGLEPVPDEESALAWIERIPGARWGWLPRVERFLPAEGWLGGDPEPRGPAHD